MIEREVLELDVLFVGAGPASLAGAIHLQRLLRASGQEASVGVLEKAAESQNTTPQDQNTLKIWLYHCATNQLNILKLILVTQYLMDQCGIMWMLY